MNMKLIDRQPVTVAYLRHLGAYGEPISPGRVIEGWARMRCAG